MIVIRTIINSHGVSTRIIHHDILNIYINLKMGSMNTYMILEIWAS